jgi:RNA polymerase sigma factor (sigma-70 family)
MNQPGDHPRERTEAGAGADDDSAVCSAMLDAAQVVALYEEHGSELRRFVLGVLRNPELASDVVQATFAKVIELGHTSRGETRKGWLFRVALHEALALKRRQATRDDANRRLAGLWRNRGEPPEERLIQLEQVARVRQAIAQLPPEMSKVVLQRLYEDKTFAEIARESGLPLGTVLTRMRLAVEKLRGLLRAGE